ncbi:hypothetical protein ABT299_22445 [Spirillospora sp. NPDC000708]
MILAHTHVDDLRETDHAWIATTAGLFREPRLVNVGAGDDADDTTWCPLHRPGRRRQGARHPSTVANCTPRTTRCVPARWITSPILRSPEPGPDAPVSAIVIWLY